MVERRLSGENYRGGIDAKIECCYGEQKVKKEEPEKESNSSQMADCKVTLEVLSWLGRW